MDIKAEFDKALAIWREFGKPVEKIRYRVTDDLSYPNLHFHEGETLSEALPLADAGKYSQAEAVVEKARSVNGQRFEDCGDDWLGSRIDNSYESRTAMLVYKHLVNEYLDLKPADEVLKQLVSLQKCGLIKASRRSVSGDSRGIETFIEELKLTMSPTGSAQNSSQAAVDELVNLKRASRDPYGVTPSPEDPPQYKKILDFGLDAIEPLLNDLGSKKLTRTFLIGMMMGRSQVLTVDNFAEDLILRIANGDLGDSEDGRLDKKMVQEWLAAKRSDKVEDWLLANLYFQDKEIGNYCNYRTFNALAVAHPHLLGKAFRIIQAAKADPHLALVALEKAKLSEKEKNEIRSGAVNADYNEAESALWHIHAHDMKKFDEALLGFLAKVQKLFDPKYADVSRFAIGTDNPKVWKLLKEKVDQADTPMKMCLLTMMGGADEGLKPYVFNDKSAKFLMAYFDVKDKVSPSIKYPVFPRFAFRETGEPRSVGQVALEAAAWAANVLHDNVPKIDEAGWKKIRNQIEAKYKK